MGLRERYDETTRTWTVSPADGDAPRGRILLLHGATPKAVRLLAPVSSVPPGVCSVGGTARRLAGRGFEVFVPEADKGAGFHGDWVSHVRDWGAAGPPPVAIVGYSFGGSSAVIVRHDLRAVPWVKHARMVLLDPALRSDAVGAMLRALDCEMYVLFAERYKTKGREQFARHPCAVIERVPGTRHRHFTQPLGPLGVLHGLDLSVDRAYAALERALPPLGSTSPHPRPRG